MPITMTGLYIERRKLKSEIVYRYFDKKVDLQRDEFLKLETQAKSFSILIFKMLHLK